ncbi:MAG: ribonuclease HII [Pseudodesulfovibrio sp.]|uniref:Ribonuclease HII n=1 Tax=Pseudodesulfovibrio aespoeensis (strain ATCC 700646 / DSM 10631 / Aspo-2) TaxID=643562 RepID=E6VQQ7_PSEA9|nr:MULTISPECIES: ribonuclease HII [Pseudodesulfovibrio]MBU4243057.1 ribonuclease HII [Pseudomonadota bacterium]ADU61784.1 Ribonuclease H [Pseudodesulfovibrio aespoeensis Aspo-2]MBU4379497.1 ribonuclease HII [Pseudomonadota bacterium]MBU4476684.1 ribonuclease HII [Pseudomonadota bacterium]MBU4515827.1 ribonuclease HII [Pseudomonadota bacterium]
MNHPPFPPDAIAGVDEAGRGCLAGPVVAGACILPQTYDLPGLNDSKQLSAAKRETLYPLIRSQAVAWAVGLSWPGEIDRVNILQATFLAMGRAVRALKLSPRFLRIDGNKIIPAHALGLGVSQEWVIGGDGSVPAISAASVLAKTFRDRLMVKLAARYPGYGLERHMGYGTKEHMEAVARLGPCAMHRLTFRGVRPEPAVQRQGRLI